MNEYKARCTAFEGTRKIATGGLHEVALAAKNALAALPQACLLIFDDDTGRVVEVDYRGPACEFIARLPQVPLSDAADSGPESVQEKPVRGPGRPRLGVVAREVTLLPRHWEWLATQPGGASVALRKLVEEARRANASSDRARQRQEAAYRFMSALAGDFQDFEEAMRAFFANDEARFKVLTSSWPADVCEHSRKLAAKAFAEVRGIEMNR